MDKTSRQLDFSRMHAAVPRFFLYGEPVREAAEGFTHVETVADRSRLYDWRIRPHAHRDLHQVLLVTAGRGRMQVESGVQPFRAPALLIVPATLVHGFEFQRETGGFVVSAAQSLLWALAEREPVLGAVFSAVAAVDLGSCAGETEELERAAALLHREAMWSAPAQRTAVQARLAILLVEVARTLVHRGILARGDASGRCAGGPRAALVARFRDLLEQRYRGGWLLADYARALGVSPGRLRAACADVTGKPPMRLVHERVLLEAKRLLTHSYLSIAATAYQLGFADPDYFSRFFSAHAGEPPGAFRRRTAERAGGDS